jgi:hypothetical protein
MKGRVIFHRSPEFALKEGKEGSEKSSEKLVERGYKIGTSQLKTQFARNLVPFRIRQEVVEQYTS